MEFNIAPTVPFTHTAEHPIIYQIIRSKKKYQDLPLLHADSSGLCAKSPASARSESQIPPKNTVSKEQSYQNQRGKFCVSG